MRLKQVTFLLVTAVVAMLGGWLPASAEIKTVYVVVPSHLDIGFTAPPDTVARGYKGCIDRAIQLCEKYPDYFYTIECAWQLREWMKRSTPNEVRKLAALVESGRVELAGAFANMHSGMMSGESVNRMFDLGFSLAKKLGGDVTTAIQDDVPGYTWAYPQAMRQHGIRYFLTGINTSFGGEPKLTYKDIPFYWEGPDGSRVLTWIANGYTNASQWGIGIWEKEEDVFRKVPEQASAIERAGYPYDAFLIMASPGDNVDAAATEKIHRIIGKWNATGKSPEIKMATPRQFFKYMQKRDGDRFPTYRGDWSGHWAPAKLGSPRLIARMRFAQRILPAAESLWSVLALAGAARFPAEDFSAAWDDLLTISGHTAAAGTGWPDLTTKEQVVWENWQHAFRSLSASYGSSMLMHEGMKILADSVSADYPFIVVFNSLCWQRTGYVEVSIPAKVLKQGLTITAKNSTERMEWDLLEDGRTLRFLARDVPAMGYKVFHVSPGPPRKPPVAAAAHNLDTRRFAILIDPRTGYIKSIYDKKHQREWVEKGRLFAALHLARHLDAMTGGTPQQAKGRAVRIERVTGNTYKTLRVRRKECPLIETSVTAFDIPPEIRIENTLDISKIPGDDRVVAVLEFPFNLDAESLKVGLDGPNHFRRWPDDFLPGAARIGQVVQSYALLHDDKAQVRFIPVEAPILSLGKIGLHSLDKPTSARIYSYLFDRELWGQNKDTGRTRYDEVEPGLGTKISFSYYLDFGAASKPGDSSGPPDGKGFLRRNALEATVPLFAAFRSPWGRQKGRLGEAATRSFLEFDKPDIELSSASLVFWQGAVFWQLRLQENSGLGPHNLRAKPVGLPVRSAWLLDPPGDRRRPLGIEETSLPIPISPFRTTTVLIEPEAKAR